jgi:hypothetical protein
MATEALMQANQRARNKGRPEIDAESRGFFIGQVCVLSVATIFSAHKMVDQKFGFPMAVAT